MDANTAATRARVACRIYVDLYDAGHDGLIFASGADHIPGKSMVDDPALVREVIQRLREVGVIRERDSSHPGIAVLSPDARSRMELPMFNTETIVERLRRDLSATDRGDANGPNDFLNLESMVRTGATFTRGL